MDILAARKIACMIARPYARRFSLDSEEAEQVAWIAAWRAIETHDAARSKITTWITRCVRLGLSDWRRNSSEWGKGSPVVGCVRGKYGTKAYSLSEHEQRPKSSFGRSDRRGDVIPEDSHLPEVAIDDADQVAAITRRAFGGDLLRRRYLAGESVVEIAASMGLHPSAIDQRLRRAIAEIRAEAG